MKKPNCPTCAHSMERAFANLDSGGPVTYGWQCLQASCEDKGAFRADATVIAQLMAQRDEGKPEVIPTGPLFKPRTKHGAHVRVLGRTVCAEGNTCTGHCMVAPVGLDDEPKLSHALTFHVHELDELIAVLRALRAGLGGPS